MTGRVIALYRHPVKSMRGEQLRSLELDGRGALGDRTYALWDVYRERPRRLTARQLGRMLAWSASYDGDDTSPPSVTTPDGHRMRIDDEALPAALGADLGRPVRITRDPGGQQDRPRTLLVTIESTRAAIAQTLEHDLDIRRFRPNIHVELDAEPFAEEDWPGRSLRVGAVELELLKPCVRCVIPTRDPDTLERWPQLARWLSAQHGMRFGVIARAHAQGRVELGDAVTLL